MQYRIIELDLGQGLAEVRVQCKGWWRWHTIWKELCSNPDYRDYARLCAEEIKEKLEDDICPCAIL